MRKRGLTQRILTFSKYMNIKEDIKSIRGLTEQFSLQAERCCGSVKMHAG